MQDYYLLKCLEEMTKWTAVGCCCYLWLCSSFLEVMDNTEIHAVPNILMMVGLASIGTNWVASRVCQDSLDASRFPRWKVFLLGWFVVAALICCLLVSVVVLSYALQGRLEESLKVGSQMSRRRAAVRDICAVNRTESSGPQSNHNESNKPADWRKGDVDCLSSGKGSELGSSHLGWAIGAVKGNRSLLCRLYPSEKLELSQSCLNNTLKPQALAQLNILMFRFISLKKLPFIPFSVQGI